MIISNNINPQVPERIKAFIKQVSTIPAPNFDAIICAESVDVQAYESSYSVIFSGIKKTVNVNLVYPWIPKGYRCSGIAWMDDLFTVNIQNAFINIQ